MVFVSSSFACQTECWKDMGLFGAISGWSMNGETCSNLRAVGDALVLDFGLQFQQILMETKSMHVMKSWQVLCSTTFLTCGTSSDFQCLWLQFKENISQGRGCAAWMELCNKKPPTFLMSSSGRSVMEGDSSGAINDSKNKYTVEPTDVASIVFMIK